LFRLILFFKRVPPFAVPHFSRLAQKRPRDRPIWSFFCSLTSTMGDPTKQDTIWKQHCDGVMKQWQHSRSTPSPPPDPPAFRAPAPGEQIQVAGIRRRRELNGACGEIIDPNVDAHGRVGVQLSVKGGHRTMRIQPFCLRPLGESSSTPALLQDIDDSASAVSGFLPPASRNAGGFGHPSAPAANHVFSSKAERSRPTPRVPAVETSSHLSPSMMRSSMMRQQKTLDPWVTKTPKSNHWTLSHPQTQLVDDLAASSLYVLPTGMSRGRRRQFTLPPTSFSALS